MDNFVWGTKVVTTFLYDDFGAVTNETVLGVAGTNTIERYYDSVGRSLGYGCVDWQMAVVDAVNDSADANSSCFRLLGWGRFIRSRNGRYTIGQRFSDLTCHISIPRTYEDLKV